MTEEEQAEATERRRVEFISKYKALCNEYKFFIIQVKEDDYYPNVVADFTEDPSALDKQVLELMVEDLRYAEPEDKHE